MRSFELLAEQSVRPPDQGLPLRTELGGLGRNDACDCLRLAELFLQSLAVSIGKGRWVPLGRHSVCFGTASGLERGPAAVLHRTRPQ